MLAASRTIFPIVTVLALAVTSAHGITINYNADVAPDDPSLQDVFTTFMGGTTSWNASGGELTITTVPGAPIWFGNHPTFDVVPWQIANNSEGNSVSCRAKLGPSSGEWAIQFADDTHSATFVLMDGVAQYFTPSGEQLHAIDTNVFHTYSFLLANAEVSYRIDGQLIYSGPASSAGSPTKLLLIGDGSGPGGFGFGTMIVDDLAITTCTSSPSGGGVTILDGQFDDIDWSSTIVFAENGPAQDAFRVETGGAPGSFRRMEHIFPGPSVIVVFHEYTASSYDLSAQGSIETVDYAEDHIEFDPPFSGAAIGGSPGLIQDGVVFAGPGFEFTTLSWDHFELTCLTANDFADVTGNGQHPDFSTSGSAIRFGYIRSNTHLSTPASAHHGIDNWSFTVHSSQSIPTVSQWGLAAMALLLLTAGTVVYSKRRPLAG